MIKFDKTSGKYRYFDKYGQEILEGNYILMDGRYRRVYMLDKEINELGTDATNPSWVKSGRAVPCEYGCYPITPQDTEECICYEVQNDGNIKAKHDGAILNAWEVELDDEYTEDAQLS